MIKPQCLILFLLIAKVSADCKLNANIIQTVNRIFAYRSGTQLYPLRVDGVPTGQELELICNSTDVVNVTCMQNGKFEPNLPVGKKRCENPISESLQKIQHPSCIKTMFLVGYHFENQFLQLYRSCYDEDIKGANFVIHHLYDYTMSNGPRIDLWTRDLVITGAVEASFKCENTYQRFKYLFGQGQSYLKKDSCRAFDRGHLAALHDFAFESYRKSTCKFINAVPQFYRNNVGIWKKVENFIRKELKKQQDSLKSFQICTGALGVLQLAKGKIMKDVYLYGGNPTHPTLLNPAPKWIYKVVSDGGTLLYAFHTYNNIDENAQPARICSPFDCPTYFKGSTNIFCCDPIEFITNYAGHCSPHFHEDQVPH